MDSIQQNYNFEHIPDELKQLKQWVCWKYLDRDGKLTKPPVNPHTGKHTNGLDPDTWLTFNEAVEHYRNGAIDGIGISFGNGLSGTDLDKCIKPDGTLTNDAKEILNLLGSTYTEYSPSGRGLHFLHWGQKPTGYMCNTRGMPEMDGLEMYDAKHYFTVTGRVYGDQPKPLLDMTEPMNIICQKYLLKQSNSSDQKPSNPTPLPTTERGDLEVLDAIKRSKSAAQILSLWSGDTSAYGGDHSRADAALVDSLLFHSGGNEVITDRLFRQSKLMRVKWDEKHNSTGQTYGEMTIQRIKSGHEAEGKYNWQSPKQTNQPAPSPELSAQFNDKIEELKAVPFDNEKAKFYYSDILPLLHQLSEVERAQGINTLASILKVPKTSITKDLKNALPKQLMATNQTNKTTLPAVYNDWLSCLKGTDYALDNIGNFGYWKITESGDEIFIPMANFVARPIREIIMDNGQEQTRYFEIAGLLTNGYPLPTIQVEAGKFASLSWILGAWGVKANVRSGAAVKDRLRNAIQALAKHGVKQETIYSHIGWRKINDHWLYLHGGGAIGQNNTGIKVDLADGMGRTELSSYLFLPPAGGIQESIQASLSILKIAPAAIVYPLLALVYLSPLCEPMKQGTGSEPSFLLWLYGQSGCMKSTLAALCLAHFGTFSNKSFPASFKDTAASIEKKGFTLKDSLMVIDDYFPVTSSKEANRMEAIAQNIARGWGDRTGRGRLQADTKTKAGYAPKGMVLVTGEDVPNIGQSGTARMINIEMRTGDIDQSKLTTLQCQTGQLNHAMRGYIEWLQPQMSELPQRFREEFSSFRKQVVNANQHGRLIEAVVWLYMGFNMFMEYAVTYAAISSEQADHYRTIAWNEFLNAAKEQAKATEEDSPVTKFIEALNEMLMTKTARVTPITDEGVGMENELYAESIGYCDHKFYYLLPKKACGAVVAFYKEQGLHFPIRDLTLWKYLANKKIILPANDSTKKQKKVNGKNDRYIWLYKSALDIPDET